MINVSSRKTVREIAPARADSLLNKRNERERAAYVDVVHGRLGTLAEMDNWVPYKLVPSKTRPGKFDKLPIDPNTGRLARQNSSDTWGTFEQAASYYLADPYCHGLGFQLGESIHSKSGIVGLDFDNCIFPPFAEGGRVNSEVMSYIRKLDTYTEVSPSGTGLRLFAKGLLHPSGRKKGEIEVYDCGRFLTVTGNHLEGTPLNINKRTDQLAEFHQEIFYQPVIGHSSGLQFASINDSALLKKAKMAANGEKFERLFLGNINGYPSHSEADLALCSQLAFWSTEESQIDRLFRQSGLIRPKWDERHSSDGRTYGQITIQKALSFVTERYTPGTNNHRLLTQSADNTEFLLTESPDHEGHAQCLNRLFPEKFLHCDALGWLQYTGSHWETQGAQATLDRAAVDTLKTRRLAAIEAEREKIVKSTRGSQQNKNGTKDLFKSLVNISITKFDDEPHLLNCRNGVLDLRTRKLMTHEPGQRFSYCLDTCFEPEAIATDEGFRWMGFISDVLNSNVDLGQFLQMAVGYSLSGLTWEEVLFYVYGPTRAGKGTFAETLLALLGRPLSASLEFQSLTSPRYGDTQNFDLAGLKPCRLVVSSESQKYQALNTAKIKQITGGDHIRAVHKYRDPFEYRPQFKLWLLSNHPINVDVDDDAAWARVRVIHFPNSYLGQEDKGLKHSFRQPKSLEAVLAWAAEGARQWFASEKGLIAPRSVTVATERQRRELDDVQQFIDECCLIGTDEDFVVGSALYQSYENWCHDNGYKPRLRRGLSNALSTKGFRLGQKKLHKNTRGVFGLVLDTRE